MTLPPSNVSARLGSASSALPQILVAENLCYNSFRSSKG